jgi:WD40 repeat protein
MAKNWYIFKDNQHTGPFTVQQLSELVESGHLSQSDQLSLGPDTKPRPVSRVPAVNNKSAWSTDNARPKTPTKDKPAPPLKPEESRGLLPWLRSEKIRRFAWPSVLIGLVVLGASAARWFDQWSFAERTAATILQANDAWDKGDRATAADLYGLTLEQLERGTTASFVFQRVIEVELEQGEDEFARATINLALDRSIEIQLGSLNGQRLLADVIAQRESAGDDKVLIADGDGEPLFPQLVSHPLVELPGSNRELAILTPGTNRFVLDGEARAFWESEDQEAIVSFREVDSNSNSEHQGIIVSKSIYTGRELETRNVSWEGRLLAVSPNGQWLVAQQSDDVAIYRLSDSAKKITISDINSTAVVFSQDGSRVALRERDRIQIHETATGKRLQLLSRSESSVFCFSSDATLFAYSSYKSVKVVNVKLGTHVAGFSLSRDQMPAVMTFLPGRNDQLLLGGNFRNASVDLWSVTDNMKLSSFRAHVNDENSSSVRVVAIQCDPNGESIVSSSSQGRVCWWELNSNRMLASYYSIGKVRRPITKEENSYVIGSGRFDLPKLATVNIDQPRPMPRIPQDEVLHCEQPAFKIDGAQADQFGFSQDGRLLVAAEEPPQVGRQIPRFYHVESGLQLAPMSYESDMHLFKPASSQLPWRPAIDSADWYDLCIFRSFVLSDPDRAEVVRQLCGLQSFQNRQTFSPDGTIIALSGSRALTFHDTESGDEVVKLASRQYGAFSDCIIAPDNRSVAIVQRRSGSVWDLETGQRQIQPFRSSGKCLEYSQDGRLLAAIDDAGLLRFWSTDDWKEVASFEPPKVRQDWAGFNPSGTHFATIMHTASGRDVKIWNIATNALESTISARNVVTVRFIHDDRLWIWENAQRKTEDRIALYSLKGKELARIQMPVNEINKVRFSPSGRHVATYSYPGEISVWDIYNSR